jgi:hypothetical protein
MKGVHDCEACDRCGGCGCPGGGLCRYCTEMEHAQRQIAVDRRRWATQLDDPSRRYATTTTSSSKLHERDCLVIRSAVATAEHEALTLDPRDVVHGGYVPLLPRLLTRDEAVKELRRGRCRTCSPDLPERPRRVPKKQSGLGWPLDDGRCVKSPYDLVRKRRDKA